MRPNCYKIDSVLPVRTTLHPYPAQFKVLLVACALVVGIWTLGIILLIQSEDFTDSGVGCIEDCLEIQDEIDEVRP